MFKSHKFEYNYSYPPEHDTYAKLIAYTDSVLLPIGFIKEELGLSQDGGFMLYGYRNDNKNSGKPVFWLDSNIHGSEFQTPFYCLDFINLVWGDTHYDKRITKLIRDNFNMYYIPSLNPWGYENKKYYNSRGVNLNRNYDSRWELYVGDNQWEGNNYKGTAPESEAEIKHAVKKFLEVKPFVAINSHTTTGHSSGIDMNRRFKKYQMLSTDMFNSYHLTLPESQTIPWNGQYSPQAQGWYGMQTSKEGTPVIASILEHQSDAMNFNAGLTFLFIIAVSVINYKENGVLNTNDPYSLIRN